MIDLCVVNHNTRKELQRFLDTLHSDLDGPNGALEKNWNLYITDNDSSDDFIPWIRENEERYKIDKLFLRQNIGYSAAINMMASKSSGDIIAVLNGDVWMTTEDCQRIEVLFNENPDIHILGPKQRDENGFITHAGIIGTNLAPKHRGWREPDPQDILYRDRINCVTVSGSAYFVRRDVWDAMTNNEKYAELYPTAVDMYRHYTKLNYHPPVPNGAFLPTPHYYEETWCSYFARHLGYNVVYDGSVSIGHSWHASTPKPGQGISHADQCFPISREIFRRACDTVGIERD
jgi:glycosyltransferase involved in cell wall biosynthesis